MDYRGCFFCKFKTRENFMKKETKWQPETKKYYYVASNNQQDCELAISKAITIATSTDKKITLLIDNDDYKLVFEDNKAIHDIVRAAKLNKNNSISCIYRGCSFNLFISDAEQSEIYNTVLVYGATCGDAMRNAYESCAQNIILIPTCIAEWEFFTKAMNPILIN